MRKQLLALALLTVTLGLAPGARSQDTPPAQPPAPATPATPANPPVATPADPAAAPVEPPAADPISALPKVKPTPPAASAHIRFEATPALWQVKGAHATLYLFGSVHVMRPEVHWENAKITRAFESSNTVYFEIPDLDMSSQMKDAPLVMELGMDMQHPLSTKISKEDLALLDAAGKKAGYGGEAIFEPMQPWMADMTLSILPVLNAGYAPTSGIDETLFQQAQKAKKPIKGFETSEQQLHILADAPMDEQVASLHKSLHDKTDTVAQTDIMLGDWTRGEVDKIAEMENGDLKKTPKLYDRMLVKRNQHFADVIATLLKDPTQGNVFVTVGAAHLAGSDSVINMLQARGFKVERIE